MVFGGDGDDDLTTDRRLNIPLIMFGGNGNDKLRGGTAGDYLDGGAGDDRLHGEGGNNILVGGLGADRLQGDDGEDLLISELLIENLGTTDPDSLLQAWSLSNRSMGDRIADLVDDLAAAIIADGAADDSNGFKGNDWYFSQLTDRHRFDPRDQDVFSHV